ncbi:MAG: FAD-binding protein, partial [Candidatus Omnitrophica bacterium]|nr:FAD-binding protein [Candidatus Omnitrophota bacterium]
MHWLNSFKGRIRFNEPLSRHTTLGIGGPADIWIEPSSVFELRQILGACLNKKLPFLVIGKGSNILAGDHGFKGIVSCLSSSAFTKIQSNKDCISCGAGLGVQGLLNQSEMLGLSGLEFLAGIPATVAGALVINAGNRSLGIGHFTESVTVMDGAGRMKVLDRKQLKFGYRRSNLPRFIVLEAKFKLSKSHPEEVRQK